MRRCVECGQAIPQGRIEALPDCDTCVRCAVVEPVTEDAPGVIDGPEVSDLLGAAHGAWESNR
jgi:hypothetical protein